jgi:putative inorganic carbon (HCO3(-)) transporter
VRGAGPWGWLPAILLIPPLLLIGPGTSWLLVLVPLVLLVQAWAGAKTSIRPVGKTWVLSGGILPLTALNPALLLLALMLLASLWASPDLALSLSKIAGLLLGFTLFFTVVRYTPAQGSWNAAFVGFIGLGVGVALLGLVGTQWFTAKLTGLNALTAHLPRWVGGLPGAEAGIHPNILAGALLWLLPPVVFGAIALVRDPGWFISPNATLRRRAWLVRVGTMAYLAAALTAVLLILAQLPLRVRQLLLVACLLGLVAGLWWAYRYDGAGQLAGLLDSLPVNDGAVSTVSLVGRLEIWSRAQWAIRDAPVTGLGMDVFRVALPMLYPLLSYNPSIPVTHAHNELLQAALDLGLPGLVAFLGLNLGAFAMLSRLLRETGVARLLALGLGGGLLAHFLFGLTDATALGGRPGVIFWILLGLIASLYRQVAYPSSSEAARP